MSQILLTTSPSKEDCSFIGNYSCSVTPAGSLYSRCRGLWDWNPNFRYSAPLSTLSTRKGWLHQSGFCFCFRSTCNGIERSSPSHHNTNLDLLFGKYIYTSIPAVCRGLKLDSNRSDSEFPLLFRWRSGNHLVFKSRSYSSTWKRFTGWAELYLMWRVLLIIYR